MSCTLYDLYPDLIEIILKHLNLKDLVNCGKINTKWYKVSCNLHQHELIHADELKYNLSRNALDQALKSCYGLYIMTEEKRTNKLYLKAQKLNFIPSTMSLKHFKLQLQADETASQSGMIACYGYASSGKSTLLSSEERCPSVIGRPFNNLSSLAWLTYLID